MIDPEDFLRSIIHPGLAWVEVNGGPPVRPEAAQFLLAVAITETNLACRCQVLSGGKPGPARGWYQFEQGGVRGVLTHKTSRAMALKLCRMAYVEPEAVAIWRALEGHDMLATAWARLLLWTDPLAIPTTAMGAWLAYSERLWRPGKPDLPRFTAAWSMADSAVRNLT